MKKLILFLTIIPCLLYGQTEFDKYTWTTFPAEIYPDTLKCENGAAVTLERRIWETYTNSQNYFEQVYVYHRKIKVDSNSALGAFNKIYIPLKDVIEILDIQARFLAPNGKITSLPKESIKQIANMDNQGDYKTFAIEGAELGGQIEYFYVLRRKFEAYEGFYLQDKFPKSNVENIFAYPSKIDFLIKCYNGLSPFRTETKNDKTYQKSMTRYIAPLEEEAYSNYKASLMRFEYTLAYNHFNSSLRKYSWNTVCENTFSNVYNLTKDEKSAVLSLYKQVNPKGENEQVIRSIENFVKTNFSINKDIPYQKELNEAIRLKQANEATSVKLFIALLNEANIKFEFIETGDNSTRPFDPNFNCQNYTNEYLIYFPEIEKYLVPGDVRYRLGLIPPEYQGQYGLFLHPSSYENINFLAYDIKKIPVQGNKTNSDSLLINIKLNPDGQSLGARIHRSINGALAQVFQNILSNISGDKKKEVIERFFSMGKEKSEIVTYNLANYELNNVGYKPLIFDVNLKASELIENAGNDLLIHIGESIGKQSELYQEKSRKSPIFVGILHSYFRRIAFDIPTGYKIANPENLNMNVEMKNGDEIGCKFSSNARIKGNQLIIESEEYYKDQYYSTNRYPEFRDVINASADFNKKTILLKKI